ncbi:MAG: hypothetical protein AAF678_07520, partial [Pseudomonadota bacterium]
MKRAAEVVVFGLLALVVHVALFLARPEDGAEAGGSGGEAMISIEAATPTVEQMVEAWEQQAPPVAASEQTLDQPEAPDATPPPASIALAEAPNADLQVGRVSPPDPEALALSIEQFNRRPLEVTQQPETLTPDAPAPQNAPDLSSREAARPDLAQPQMAAMQAPQAD